MSLKNIAVEGFTEQMVVIVGVTPQGVYLNTGAAAVKSRADSKAILQDGYTAQVSNVTDPGAGATTPDPGPFNLTYSAIASKVKAESKAVLREDDETNTITAYPKNSSGTPIMVVIKYKVLDAAQSKVRAQ